MRNRQHEFGGLTEILVDIATTGSNEPDWMQNVGRRFAPTQWDFVKDDSSKFGPEWDFEVAGSAFIPISDAAKAWAYSKLPDDLTLQWDAKSEKFGLDVGKQWSGFIVHRARQDKLMSEDDFRNAEEEMHRHQWGD